MQPVDLTQLRVGSRVKLRGPSKEEGIPRKPYPLGWRTVRSSVRLGDSPPTDFLVEGDERYLPVALIEEIKN